MQSWYSRRWRNNHEGCAWCDKTAFTFEIDRLGEKVGACKVHGDKLKPIRDERQGKLIADSVYRDRRIDRALWKKGRKR